jgi:hypothetical protein
MFQSVVCVRHSLHHSHKLVYILVNEKSTQINIQFPRFLVTVHCT